MYYLFRATRILSADFVSPYKPSTFFFWYISLQHVYFYASKKPTILNLARMRVYFFCLRKSALKIRVALKFQINH